MNGSKSKTHAQPSHLAHRRHDIGPEPQKDYHRQQRGDHNRNPIKDSSIKDKRFQSSGDHSKTRTHHKSTEHKTANSAVCRLQESQRTQTKSSRATTLSTVTSKTISSVSQRSIGTQTEVEVKSIGIQASTGLRRKKNLNYKRNRKQRTLEANLLGKQNPQHLKKLQKDKERVQRRVDKDVDQTKRLAKSIRKEGEASTTPAETINRAKTRAIKVIRLEDAIQNYKSGRPNQRTERVSPEKSNEIVHKRFRN